MNICLKTYAKQERQVHVSVSIPDRLPVFVHSPCELIADFHVESYRNYYVMMLDVHGTLGLTCQRCLGDFKYEYHNASKLAICRTEEVAENLMESYECIVSEDGEINLIDIITDELHLCCPEKHMDITECDGLVNQFVV